MEWDTANLKTIIIFSRIDLTKYLAFDHEKNLFRDQHKNNWSPRPQINFGLINQKKIASRNQIKYLAGGPIAVRGVRTAKNVWSARPVFLTGPHIALYTASDPSKSVFCSHG